MPVNVDNGGIQKPERNQLENSTHWSRPFKEQLGTHKDSSHNVSSLYGPNCEIVA